MTRYQIKVALLLVSTMSLAQCRTTIIQSESERRVAQYPTPIVAAEMLGANYLLADMRMPGEYMKVFDIAYSAFLTDEAIPADKRKVEDYRIELRQNDSEYKVTFVAKRQPPELEQVEGGSSDLGRDVTYIINKRTYQVAHATFYK